MKSPPTLSRKADSFQERCISRICYSFLFRFLPRRTKFSLIHRYNLWSSSESISGPGSELSRTIRIREFLQYFIQKYQIKSILDVPCGDFNWMKQVDLTGIKYFGGDIVDSLITANQRAHGSDLVKFGLVDIIESELPMSDLVIVRDLFIHFSPPNVSAAINNIIKSKSSFLLTTTWPDTSTNQKIRDGYNCNINLQIPPYCFPEPMYLIEEMRDDNGERNCVGVWSIESLKLITKSKT